jgi:hypothetical protein
MRVRGALGTLAALWPLASSCTPPGAPFNRVADAGIQEDECGPPEATSDELAACCGCLCADEHWSCSEDTCTDERGSVVGLAAEAGFLEIEPLRASGFYPYNHGDAAGARMWYSFFPAAAAPEDAPLFVFMQGGPGFSVLPLWGGNTGPNTLDTLYAGGGIATNPYSFSQLGNLLYIDTPAAGFSYRLGSDPDSDQCARIFDPDREAGQYVRVLLRFLARHPSLQGAPVFLVGESYGGVRATLMLQQLLHPGALRDPDAGYVDFALADEIEAHARRAGLGCGAAALSPSAVARQFQRQILVQPAMLGEKQSFPPEGGPGFGCPRNQAGRGTDEEQHVRLQHMLQQISDGPALSNFVGVDVGTIRWLHAEERALACQRFARQEQGLPLPGDALPGLAQTFGTLASWDAFYLLSAKPLQGTWPRSSLGEFNSAGFETADLESVPARRALPRVADLFLDNLRYVQTFITDARCDETLDIGATIAAFETLGELERVSLEPHDDLRVRDLVLYFKDGEERTLRVPEYPTAGHMVALHSPETFLSDVRDWLAETPTHSR